MITLKYWNSLTEDTRKSVSKLVLGRIKTGIEKEYHHNFDYDSLGKTVKFILEKCYKDKDGTLRVIVTIKPELKKKSSSSPKKKAEIINKPRYKRYYFRAYREDDEDGENLWARALSEQEARDEILHDNWGITELILTRVEED